MQLKSTLALLAATAHITSAAPASGGAGRSPELRLIKTSDEDEGQWMTAEQKNKLTKTGSRNHFIDITDAQDDKAFMARISTAKRQEPAIKARQGGNYPSSLSHVEEASELISNISNSGPQSWMKTMTDFHNRHYQSNYGTEAAEWLLSEVEDIASANSNIEVTTFEHSFDQPSIIALIPGSSSSGKVIVGAHFDSTAGASSARAPGADDNASGSVNVLEALRVLASAGFEPENDLEFHWYAGEEGGLLGSQQVFRSYASDGKDVLAFVNQDMTGVSPSGKPVVYTDYVSSALTSFVSLCLEEFTGLEVSESECGYRCSDHASAEAAGFPAAFVASETFDNANENIHTSEDAYDTIDWESIKRHSDFTVGFLVEASYI